MENKYYVPELWEFRVGFEYEYRTNLLDTVLNSTFMDREYEKTEFENLGYSEIDIMPEFNTIKYLLENPDDENSVRVKHLDKLDILTLGWRFLASIDGDIFNIKGHTLKFHSQDNLVSIVNDSLVFSAFHGTIKNISELRMIMNMIGIK